MTAVDPAGAVPADGRLAAGAGLRLVIGWPRYPTMTPTGKVSRARTAGKPLPWLSANAIHTLCGGFAGRSAGHGRIQPIKVAWKEATSRALTGPVPRLSVPVEVEVRLYRNRANRMDPGALVEGVKPIMDALQEGGLLQGDDDRWVSYSPASAVYPSPRGEQRVELLLRLREARIITPDPARWSAGPTGGR